MSIVIQEIMQNKIYLDLSGNIQTHEATEDEEGGTSILPSPQSSPAPQYSRGKAKSLARRLPMVREVRRASRRRRSRRWPDPTGRAPRGTDARPTAPQAERAGVGLLFACLFLALSLIAYDPADSPGSAASPPNSPPKNLCGPVGAMLAHVLFTTVGWAGYLFLFALAVLDWLTFRRREIPEKGLRFAGSGCSSSSAPR